ncbi:putative glutathione S-transferase [Xylariaceae sp. FL0662B]|nr:putative glutathione S-transferase [Xylariaceae sp. FL0662B]
MSNQEIVFFDLPSKPPCKGWSLNPWKTRFTLNFKGLDYKTEWVEYPDLKPKFKDHFPPDKGTYTIPTVILPDGTWVMDSLEIAKILEKQHPEPSLHLDSSYVEKIASIVPEVVTPLRPVYIPLVPFRILNEASLAYWYETREKLAGMPLDKYSKELGGDAAWKRAQPHIEKVTALLKENSDGPFFLGKTVSWVDFVWAGLLIFFRRIGEELFEKLLEHSGDRDVHLKLLEAVKPWSERDDH